MTKLLLSLLSVFIFISTQAQRKRGNKLPEQPVNFTLQELATGVWAAIQNDNYGKAICNAGIIDMGDKTIVFDPFMNPSAAAELREYAEFLTNKPVSMVINSHFHSDHTRGNQVFSNAHFIGTKATREAMLHTEPVEQDWEARHAPALLKAIKKRMNNAPPHERAELPLWIGYYEGMVESAGRLTITPPEIIFQDSLWIHGINRSIKLIEYKDCHTASDAVLLMPEEKIAFMGDLLVNERHPWLSDGNIHNLKLFLQNFNKETGNAYTVFIPGHGPVAGQADFGKLYDYLDLVNQLCIEANNDSLRQVLLQQPIPFRYENWMLSRFYQPNLQFLLSMMKPEDSAVK